jgi:hypothetical protein
MPNAIPVVIETRVIAFSLAHPGLGPARVSAELARERWGQIAISANGVHPVLVRHGLNTQVKRRAIVAGCAAPPAPGCPPRAGARNVTSRCLVRASWCRWTASTSVACRTRPAGSGNTRRLTSPPPGAGRSCAQPLATLGTMGVASGRPRGGRSGRTRMDARARDDRQRDRVPLGRVRSPRSRLARDVCSAVSVSRWPCLLLAHRYRLVRHPGVKPGSYPPSNAATSRSHALLSYSRLISGRHFAAAV